jgi:hypothetical protein
MNLSDDDNDGESWKGAKSKKRKKLKLNPTGFYNVEFMFKGVNWDITIENITYDDFKVTARSDKKVEQDEVEVLKRYLQTEGFEDAAKKHNLYW